LTQARALVYCLVLAACGPASVRRPTDPPPVVPAPAAVFPLATGATWTYEGTVTWAGPDGEPIEKQVTWPMQVVETIDRGQWVGFVIKGFPGDLPWSEGEAQPGDWLIVREDGRRYYLSRATPELIAAFRAGQPGTPAADDLFLETPLVDGQRICHGDDTRYCWDVAAATGGAFTLAYRTLPDHTMIEFLPGKGITAYTYGHHGTLSDVDVRLVTYRPAP
jgi:hypothetical protein